MQVADNELDDYRWLISDDAARYLAQAAAHAGSTVTLAKSLRRELSPGRAHLVMQQTELRARGRAKFAEADRMFFLRAALEQASDQHTAAYKASRFPASLPRADLCCGIGGDLLALARGGRCVGVDRDPRAALLAAGNCELLGRAAATVHCADVRVWPLDEEAVWHIDPDRRARGVRTVRLQAFQPDAEFLDQLIALRPHGAIKLAPATRVPADWAERAECEWIGVGRECRQQIAWFGRLARQPGLRTATVITPDRTATISGSVQQDIPPAESLGRFVYEPHAALLAAGLSGAWANRHEMSAVAAGVAYLTGDRPVDDGLGAQFEVIECLPFDLKKLAAALRQRRMGRLEIKHRGLRLDPRQLQQRLRVPGERSGCLIVAGHPRGARAILTRRTEPPRGAADA